MEMDSSIFEVVDFFNKKVDYIDVFMKEIGWCFIVLKFGLF